MGDAQRLVELSGLDPLLKKATASYIRKNRLTRPVSKLAALLNHPCSQEQVDKINKELYRKIRDAEGEVDPGTGKPLSFAIIDMMSHNAAKIIGEGFDIAFKDNLNVNSVTGEITVKRDASGQPDSRFLKCAAAEVTPGMPSSESSAFKGSQQGLGRTRKQKKRSKKTLRRRKVRRNMH